MVKLVKKSQNILSDRSLVKKSQIFFHKNNLGVLFFTKKYSQKGIGHNTVEFFLKVWRQFLNVFLRLISFEWSLAMMTSLLCNHLDNYSCWWNTLKWLNHLLVRPEGGWGQEPSDVAGPPSSRPPLRQDPIGKSSLAGRAVCLQRWLGSRHLLHYFQSLVGECDS